MIYIATVHYKSDKWIDIQNNYFEKYIESPFKVFAFLDDIDESHNSKYSFVTSDATLSHAEKLNVLAGHIIRKSENPKDLIIFIDGDAFPIANITNTITQLLKKYPLIAIRRIIEDGDIQPHPSFCTTTVGFWRNIKGDWREGYEWKNKRNETTSDVGGNLLGILRANDLEWYPIDRTNKLNIHPILYGIYGDIIYHHGAGFRDPIFRMSELGGAPVKIAFQKFLLKKTSKGFRNIFPKKLRDKVKSVPKAVQSDKSTSHHIYNRIKEDPTFVKTYFMKENNTR